MTTSRHVTWTPWTPDGPWLKSWDPAWETYEKRWEITIFHRKTMGKPWENHGKTMGKMVIYMERSTIFDDQ